MPRCRNGTIGQRRVWLRQLQGQSTVEGEQPPPRCLSSGRGDVVGRVLPTLPTARQDLKNSLFSPLDQPLHADALGHSCATEVICRAINPAE